MLELIEENSLNEGTIEALENLYFFQKELGVPERLLKHHEITLNVAIGIIKGLPKDFRETLNIDILLSGVFLHDIGKATAFPHELNYPGNEHEVSGHNLLLLLGFPKEIANFCISDQIESKEKLIAVISDRIWTGVRDLDLEEDLFELVSFTIGKEFWQTFSEIDRLLEEISVFSFEKYREFLNIR